jgi:hypothetical protein
MKGRTPGARETAPNRSLLALAIVALALRSSLPARGQTAPDLADLVEAIPVQVAGPEPHLSALATRLQEMVEELSPAVQVVRISGSAAARAWRRDISAANRPAAWVNIVEGGRVRVRVLGAGRNRIVLRELTVANPMTELDRERTGQTLLTALATLAEAPAHAAPIAPARETRSEAIVAPRSLAMVERGAAPRDVGGVLAARAAPVAPALRPRWTLGALYEVQRVAVGDTGRLLRGPGALVAAEWGQVPWAPEVFLSGQYRSYQVPVTSTSGANEAVVTGFSFHLGGSLAVLPAVHLGLSLGLARLNIIGKIQTIDAPPLPPDNVKPGLLVVSDNRTSAVGRVFLRFGPLGLGPVSLSAVALVETADSDLVYAGIDFADNVTTHYYDGWRPGLATEIRWR